jgi:hypothetical protein
MKTIKDILGTINEAEESEGLKEILQDVRELYAEETGDTSFANYDVGLQIIESISSELSEDAQDVIGAQLYETFFADAADAEEESDEEESDEEDIEEGMKVVKKIKKTSAEKREAHQDYTKHKSALKQKGKKWRKSAAGKKWAVKYSKFKATHKISKGKRISTT